MKLQFVAWPKWIGVGFTRLDPKQTDMAYVYDWYLYFGLWELRKWSTRKLPVADSKNAMTDT